MKARNVVMGFMAAGVMVVAGGGSASANLIWCVDDPPIQVVTPGGHSLTVNNTVYLPPSALHLKNEVYDEASASPDGHGGTLITVHVHVPSSTAHIVSNQYRFEQVAEADGGYVITTYLDVPIS